MWPREGWGRTLAFGTSRAAVGARMAKLLNGSTYVPSCAPCGVSLHTVHGYARTIRGGGLVHFYACQRTVCHAFDVRVRFWGVVVPRSRYGFTVLLRGAAQTPRARAAIHGWEALQTEQAVSYNRSRNFAAILDHQPVPENSLRADRSKPSSCGERPNVESAGTATSRRQHLPVRREVRPEEVRCLRPTPAVHSRPLPAAVRTVCPLSALLTHCIAVVWQ